MFRQPLDIDPGDIDHMGHVNNAVYLRWVQDAVVRYWESTAPAEAVARHLWVALKHEITYRKPAFLDDEIVAEVVADSARGARSFFRTLVKRGEDVLAEISSCWCCLDAETRRPVRLGSDIIGRFVDRGEGRLE